MLKLISLITLATILAITLFTVLRATAATPAARVALPKPRYFEMRTYTAADGKLTDLHARFRDHTSALFTKHGIAIVGFWSPTDPEAAKNTLIYILAYPDKDSRDKLWNEFQTDPEWVKAKADSEKNGKLVDKVVSTFMTPTDYSPVK